MNRITAEISPYQQQIWAVGEIQPTGPDESSAQGDVVKLIQPEERCDSNLEHILNGINNPNIWLTDY